MAFTEEDKQRMDNAATDAENDLLEVDNEALAVVANWWRKWYGKAGHKRLARVLLQYSASSSNGKVVLNNETGKFEQAVDE